MINALRNLFDNGERLSEISRQVDRARAVTRRIQDAASPAQMSTELPLRSFEEVDVMTQDAKEAEAAALKQRIARAEERARIEFRVQTFHEMARAGTISMSLPPEIVDRFLDRMWRMLHSPEKKDQNR